jgi:hypothetical protein
MAASGAVVWRNSVRAVAVSELFAPGREIWSELRRGQANLLTAFEDLQAIGVIGERPMPEVWYPRSLVQESPDVSDAMPENTGSLEDHVVDKAAAEAARPFLQDAARYLKWETTFSGEAWALGATAGVASRIRDHAIRPLALTAENAKGADRIAVDLCLFCICDALSQRTGTMFEFTTLVAFAPSAETVKLSPTVEKAVEKSKVRHDLAAHLFNTWSAEQEAQECFRYIGKGAIRFLKEPGESHVGSIRSAYLQLRAVVESRLSKRNSNGSANSA